MDSLQIQSSRCRFGHLFPGESRPVERPQYRFGCGSAGWPKFLDPRARFASASILESAASLRPDDLSAAGHRRVADRIRETTVEPAPRLIAEGPRSRTPWKQLDTRKACLGDWRNTTWGFPAPSRACVISDSDQMTARANASLACPPETSANSANREKNHPELNAACSSPHPQISH